MHRCGPRQATRQAGRHAEQAARSICSPKVGRARRFCRAQDRTLRARIAFVRGIHGGPAGAPLRHEPVCRGSFWRRHRSGPRAPDIWRSPPRRHKGGAPRLAPASRRPAQYTAGPSPGTRPDNLGAPARKPGGKLALDTAPFSYHASRGASWPSTRRPLAIKQAGGKQASQPRRPATRKPSRRDNGAL